MIEVCILTAALRLRANPHDLDDLVMSLNDEDARIEHDRNIKFNRSWITFATHGKKEHFIHQ